MSEFMVATIREMTMHDYNAVIALMNNTPGIQVRDADSRAATEGYLLRNPGFSFVAEIDQRIVGCVMCGHDGRRGYLQHLVVVPTQRRRGIGAALVSASLQRLQAIGILKTHIDVQASNADGIAYWRKQGWQQRVDLCRFSMDGSEGGNA